jgi:hypothetical protein
MTAPASEPFSIASYQQYVAVHGPPKTQQQLDADKYREHFMEVAYKEYRKFIKIAIENKEDHVKIPMSHVMYTIAPDRATAQIEGISKNARFFEGPIVILFDELFQKIKNENPTHDLIYKIHEDSDSLPNDPYGFILYWQPKHF